MSRFRDLQRLLQVSACARSQEERQRASQLALRLIRDEYMASPYPSGTGGEVVEAGVGPGECLVPTPHPQSAVHPPDSHDTIQPMMAPSRWLVVEDPPTVAADSESDQASLDFRAGGGWIIGMRGTAIDFETPGAFSAGEVEQASLGVRMRMNGQESLVDNGNGDDFVKYSDLFPPAQNYAPVMRRVGYEDKLIISWKNFQPAGGVTLTPSLMFLFWRERYPGDLAPWEGGPVRDSSGR